LCSGPVGSMLDCQSRSNRLKIFARANLFKISALPVPLSNLSYDMYTYCTQSVGWCDSKC